MGDVLTYFGTNPILLGLATIGGLLSLLLFIWRGIANLKSAKRFFSSNIRSRRRRRLLRDIRDYKIAIARKKQGVSDVAIATLEFHQFGRSLINGCMSILVGSINIFLYAYASEESINSIPAMLFLTLAIFDLSKSSSSLTRAFQLMAWANYPEANRQILLGRASALRASRK